MQLHVRPRVMVSLSIVALLTVIAGCAAVHTSIAKKDLDVQTKMSDTIFLDPVGPDKKVIFVQLRNTSDKPFDIEGPIVSAIAARGYRVTQDPGLPCARDMRWSTGARLGFLGRGCRVV